MKLKILIEVEIDEESSLVPVTCDESLRRKETENMVKDVIKDILYDMDDIEVNNIKVVKK
tara:strand:+ start:184 stop:363 length:180 start_codon:yes stop_codon:yes gene_type:complete